MFERRVGRGVGALLAGLVVAGLTAAGAGAQTLESFTIASNFVDVSKVQFNAPPPGVAPRPPALTVNVLLPDGYATATAPVPVLYLLHGHGDSFDSWVNPQRGDLLDIAKGFPGIVVMPEAATGWYTNWWDNGARGSDGRGWERYFEEEVIPTVESRYRIAAGRQNHAIAGLSMGGEGAIFFAEALPGYFGSAASFSGCLSLQRPEWPTGFDTQGQNHNDVFGDPNSQSFYWHGHNPAALAPNAAHTRLFVRVGDGTPYPYTLQEATNYFGAVAEAELHQHASDFGTAANAAGAELLYQQVSGVHDWPYWRDALTAALKWGFFEPVEETATAWTYQTVAQQGQAWNVGFVFDRAPEEVATFTRSGSTLSGSGQGRVTLKLADGSSVAATLPFSSLPLPPGS